MLKILAIAPNEGLGAAIARASQQQADMQLLLRVADLHEAIDVLQEIPETDYDLILSRGGTARLLARYATKPVVEIHASIFDLLRAVRLASSCAKDFAVVGFPNTTQNMDTLLELMRCKASVFTISNQQEASQCLAELQQAGCSVIIGDTVAVRQAQALRMNGILINSGEESILAALQEAKTLYGHLRRREMENAMLRSMLAGQSTAFAVFSQDGQVILQSGLLAQPQWQERCQALVEKALVQQQLSLYKRWEGTAYQITARAVMFQGDRYVQVVMAEKPWTDEHAAIVLNSEEDVFDVHDLVGSMSELVRQATQLSPAATPVLIQAEEGSDLSALLQALRQNAACAAWPVIRVDCRHMTAKTWRFLTEKDASPLNENHQVLELLYPERLTEEQQQQLIDFAKASRLTARNRVLFLVEKGCEMPPILRFALAEQAVMFSIPPLRERPEDIPALCSLLLGYMNARFSKQILGITPQGLVTMEQYAWPGNSLQLYRLMQQLVMTCNGKEIETSAVVAALAGEQQLYAKAAYPHAPEGTLDEIMRQVAQAVLADEGMNKTRAAQRLGIGRTTLWRLLSEKE